MTGSGAHLLRYIVVFSMLSLCACAATSPQVVYYTLDTGESVTRTAGAGTACTSKSIGIGQINWPRYLDQPRIVTRSGSNKLDFNEFHRWGGSLQDDFEQVVKKNLSLLLQSGKIADYRLTRRIKPDYRVELDIKQFEGRLGGEVTLDAAWIVVHHKTGKVLGLHDSRITQQSPGPGYENLVRASSKAVTGLSQDIAAELLTVCSSVK